MRIVHISSHAGLNGAAQVALFLARLQVARGHDVTLVHRPSAWIAEQGTDLRCQALDMGVRLIPAAALRDLKAWLGDWGVDVLHSHGTTADRVAARLYRSGSHATVATAHARVLHPHWRRHDLVITPSDYTAAWYRRWHLVRADRLQTVPNTVEPHDAGMSRSEARAEFGLPDTAFAIASVGGIMPRKRQSASVPLVAALRQRGIDARLVVIGHDSGEEADLLRRNIAAAGLERSISVVGPRDDVRDLLPGFDLMLSTSRDEQGSIVLLEALAAGLPLAATPVGSATELLGYGEIGTLVDLARPEAALDFIERLATQSEFAAGVRNAALKTYRERLGPEATLDAMDRAYARAISLARGAG